MEASDKLERNPPATFKTTPASWIKWGLSTLLLSILCIPFIILGARRSWDGGIWMFPLTILAIFVWQFLGLLRLRLEIDEPSIRFRTLFEKGTIRWQDVFWVNMQENNSKPDFVGFLTLDRAWSISLRRYNREAIRVLIRSYLPSEVFKPDAIDRYNEAIHQSYLNETWPANRKLKIRIGYTIVWVSAALAIVLIGALIAIGQVGSLLILLVFIPGLFLLSFWFPRTIELDSLSITDHCWWSRRKIQWREIETVRTDPEHSQYVFEGGGKRFSTLGSFWWGGRDGQRAKRLFMVELEKREIPVHMDRWISWKFIRSSSNTRE